MKNLNRLLLLIFSLCSMQTFAQGLDPAPAGVMISHAHPKGNWMFSYTYMNCSMNGNISGTQKVSDATIYNNYIMSPQNMQMNMHMLMAMYGVTGRLTIMGMVNYNSMTMSMNMLPGSKMFMDGVWMTMGPTNSTMKMTSSGIGDTKLYGIYKLYNGESSSFVGSLGFNIPTGSITMQGDRMHLNDGQHLTYMMQNGTGTVDFMPGLTFLKRTGRITWSTQATAIIRPFNNKLNYHYGNEINLNVWAAYKINSSFSASLRMDANKADAISGNDATIESNLETDANTANYGGKQLNGYTGINYYINTGVLKYSKVAIEYGLPVYQNLNGIQLAQRSTLFASYIIDL